MVLSLTGRHTTARERRSDPAMFSLPILLSDPVAILSLYRSVSSSIHRFDSFKSVLYALRKKCSNWMRKLLVKKSQSFECKLNGIVLATISSGGILRCPAGAFNFLMASCLLSSNEQEVSIPFPPFPFFSFLFFLLFSNTVAVQDISFPLLADDVIYAIWWERKEELGGVNCCVEAASRRTVLSSFSGQLTIFNNNLYSSSSFN